MVQKLSDLTKDTRPKLSDLLLEAIHDTIEIDKLKSNDNGDMVAHENKTFYYRTLYLFMQKVDKYYTQEEVSDWVTVEILKYPLMPKINELKDNL